MTLAGWCLSAFLVVVALLVVRVALDPNPSLAKPNRVATLALTLTTLLVWRWRLSAAFERVSRELDQDDRRRRRLIISVIVGIACAQFVIAYAAIPVRFSWDAGIVEQMAREFADAGRVHPDTGRYLVLFPNNRGVVAIFGAVLWVASRSPWKQAETIAIFLPNVVAMSAACALTYVVARRASSTKAALISLALSGLLIGLSPWGSVPYGDALGLPFPILSVYCLMRVVSARDTRETLLSAACLGVAGAAGFVLRPPTAVAVVAVLVGLTAGAALVRTRELRARRAVSAAVVAASFAVTAVAMGRVVSHERIVPPESRSSEVMMPIEYLALYGLSSNVNHDDVVYYGTWNAEDAAAVFSGRTTDERRAITRDLIRQRVQRLGPRYLVFAAEKMTWVLSDGTFFAYGEGSDQELPARHTDLLARAVRAVFHVHGRLSFVWVTAVQAGWLMVLGLLALKASRRPTTPDTVAWVIYLTIAGAMLHLLLFEGRSRYLLIFVPVFVVAALSADPRTRSGGL